METYVFDGTAPTTPSNIVRSGPANAPVFTFDPSTDVTSGIKEYEIRFNGDINDDTNFVSIGDNTSFKAEDVPGAGLMTGSNTVFIRAVDRAGNTSPATESARFVFINDSINTFELVEDSANGFDLAVDIGGRGVDDVEEQERVAQLFEGGVKGGHQLFGQIANKSHGIAEQCRMLSGDIETPQSGIQGGE